MSLVLDKEQMWSAEEIRDLILFAKELQQTNEDLRSGIILMQAKLDNEEAKVKKLLLVLKQNNITIVEKNIFFIFNFLFKQINTRKRLSI